MSFTSSYENKKYQKVKRLLFRRIYRIHLVRQTVPQLRKKHELNRFFYSKTWNMWIWHKSTIQKDLESPQICQVFREFLSPVVDGFSCGCAGAWSSPSRALACRWAQEEETLSVCQVKAKLSLCPREATAAADPVWRPGKDIAEREGWSRELKCGCAGPAGPASMGEGRGFVQGSPAREVGAARGGLLSLSWGEPRLAQSALRHDSDRGSAAGLFGAAGKAGRKRTNRSLREESRPKSCRSELGEPPEGKVGQSAPGWSVSVRILHPHSDSSWGPDHVPAGAVWFSGRISQSQQHPPHWHPEPPSQGTPARIRLFHRPRWQHWCQRLEVKRTSTKPPGFVTAKEFYWTYKTKLTGLSA